VLSIDDATVIDNDGPHAMGDKVVKCGCQKGWHEIHVGYYQGEGAYGLKLSVQAPGGEVEPVDSHAFRKGA